MSGSAINREAGPAASPVLLSALPATPKQIRLATTIGALLLVAFLAMTPFAQIRWAAAPSFVIAQQSTLVCLELITAVMLFGQYAIQGSRALIVLASGYLFTALLLIPHTLTFPGAFSPTGLLHAGPQTAAWLLVIWRSVLPATVLVYALLPTSGDAETRIDQKIFAAVLAVLLGVAASVAVSVAAHDWLPVLISADRITDTGRLAVSVGLLLTIAALLALTRRRPKSVLDVWLMVVMLAWGCSATISSVISGGRYAVGFYGGRTFAMVASLCVLFVLLAETIVLYARTARSVTLERQQRERRLHEMEALLAHMSRVNELGTIVSSLIHEVNQPLSAISNYLRAGMRLAGADTNNKLKPIIARSVEQADRAIGIIRHLRDFVAKRETERQKQDVPAMLTEAARLALTGFGATAPTVEINCAPEAQFALFDRIQIEQVVFNLVRNAAEAMIDSPRRTLEVTAALTPENLVQVSVADTGPGLPPEVQTKLFEPFVTTKPTGLGVGLSICRFIVEAHGGELRAEANPSGGTVFRFTLPRPG